VLEFSVFAVSLIVTFIITPIFIRKLKKAGIVGTDIHKKDKPKIPEMGGLAILFGFSAGVLFSILFVATDLVQIFAVLISILLLGIIGVCDDIFGIRQRTKIILPVFAAIPLMVIQAGVHSMSLPFIGRIEFGILYPLLLIPLGITVVSNSFNMLAGYNGMEVGSGVIACGAIGLIAFMLGNSAVAILMFSMSGACLAFLYFNRYPARIFPGDVGTFSIGAAFAGAVIIGNMEGIGAIIILPHIINGLMTIIDIIRGKPIKKFSEVKDGVLVPPKTQHVNTLYFFLERRFKLTEKGIVHLVWLLTLIFALAVLSIYFPLNI